MECKKIRESSFLRMDKLAISATSRELQSGMSFPPWKWDSKKMVTDFSTIPAGGTATFVQGPAGIRRVPVIPRDSVCANQQGRFSLVVPVV